MKLNRRSVFVAAAVAAISLTSASVSETASDNPIKGWLFSQSIPQEYDSGTTHFNGVAGKCAFIKARAAAPSGNATLRQEISADNYRSQRLRLSAQIKTDGAALTRLWMRVDGLQGKTLASYFMGDRPISGTTEWRRYDVVLDVPSDAVEVAFGYNLKGGGTAWARDFKLEPVGKDVPVSAPPNGPLPNAPVNTDFKQ